LPISYKKLATVLERENKTFYTLRRDKIAGSATIKKLQDNKGDIDTKTISSLCKYLNCQPGDIMEFIPDEEEGE
jgi:DNA-binding Xre family transcriptional regulator